MTREEIISEIRELEKYLLAFKQARDCIQARLRETEDNPERHAMLSDWPPFNVIDNGCIIAIVRCEGLLEDYRKLLDQLNAPNNVVRLEKKP